MFTYYFDGPKNTDIRSKKRKILPLSHAAQRFNNLITKPMRQIASDHPDRYSLPTKAFASSKLVMRIFFESHSSRSRPG